MPGTSGTPTTGDPPHQGLLAARRTRATAPASGRTREYHPLVAGWWPGTDQALLVLEVDPSTMAALRPGFVRGLDDDFLDIPQHPKAVLHLRRGPASLVIGEHSLGQVNVPRSWSGITSAVLAVLPRRDSDPDTTTMAAWFLAAVENGTALLAEIAVEAAP